MVESCRCAVLGGRGGGDEVCDGLKGRRGEGGSECGTVCLKIKWSIV